MELIKLQSPQREVRSLVRQVLFTPGTYRYFWAPKWTLQPIMPLMPCTGA